MFWVSKGMIVVPWFSFFTMIEGFLWVVRVVVLLLCLTCVTACVVTADSTTEGVSNALFRP